PALPAQRQRATPMELRRRGGEIRHCGSPVESRGAGGDRQASGRQGLTRRPLPGERADPHIVRCWWPHSLHLYSTRLSPTGILTRFGAPHLPHFSSRRASTLVTVTDLRSSASFTSRSISSRLSCFVCVVCLVCLVMASCRVGRVLLTPYCFAVQPI